MDIHHRLRAQFILLPLTFTACLLLAACGDSSDDDDSNNSADTTIGIAETFNLNSGSAVLVEAKNTSATNGAGISQIVAASAVSPQPDNGYTASTIDIVNVATNSTDVTLDFAANNPSLASNATAAQLAAFIETQHNDVDASASTTVRLTISTSAIAFVDQFSVNGVTITGNTRSEVMAAINALPSIVATIDGNGVITVTASDGNDLRLNLNNPASGQTITIESLLFDTNDTATLRDSETIGDGLPNTKATIGGSVEITLNYPLQPTNPGAGNIFGAVIPVIYDEQNTFDADDPDTYNDAASVAITDSLGNNHTLTQYFVKQNDLGGTQPNRWALYVLIDDRNVGSPDANGQPAVAAFDLAFDSNGQLDTATTGAIEISHWEPLDGSGNPNNAATARITIDITGSTQFGGPFTLTNVHIN